LAFAPASLIANDYFRLARRYTENVMLLPSVFILIAAVILHYYYTIKILELAHKESVWWGVGYIFTPCLYVYVASNWSATKKTFLLSLIAIPLVILGISFQPELYGF